MPEDAGRRADRRARLPGPGRARARTTRTKERELRETLAGARTLFNASCKDAPPLAIPAPLEWGRGQQTKHRTAGFNLAIAKVGGQPAGCEIFYEIQLRFIDPNPGNPALPPAKIVTMVFSGGEDLLSGSEARGLRPSHQRDALSRRPHRSP